MMESLVIMSTHLFERGIIMMMTEDEVEDDEEKEQEKE